MNSAAAGAAKDKPGRWLMWFWPSGSESVPVRLVAAFLGLSLSAWEMLLLNPAPGWKISPFWIGFVLLAAVIQGRLLLRTAGRCVMGVQALSEPIEQFVVVLLTTLLIITGSITLLGAYSRFDFGALSVPSSAWIALPGSSALRVCEAAFMAALLGMAGITHLGSITDRPKRASGNIRPLAFVGFCFAGLYFSNVLLPALHAGSGTFETPPLVPAYDPIGIDFRQGVYMPARELLSGTFAYRNADKGPPWVYPPFAVLLGLPYLLLDPDRAYVVHVGVLFLANLACIAIAAVLSSRADGEASASPGSTPSVALVVALLVGFNWLAGYPFLFSIERGNTDILALVLCLAAMWVLLEHPKRIVWQVILLSLATHLKVYPVFLFAVMYLATGKRMIVPAALVNIGLLCILGPANALGFVDTILQRYSFSIWVGDHSGYVFALLAAVEYHVAARFVPGLVVLSTGIPLVLSVIGWIALWRFGDKSKMVVLGFMITLPLMSLFPPFSNDYELVVLSSGIVILYVGVIRAMQSSDLGAGYLLLLMISLVVLLISRSYMLLPGTAGAALSKYPWVLLLQVIMLVYVLHETRFRRLNRPTPAVAPES